MKDTKHEKFSPTSILNTSQVYSKTETVLGYKNLENKTSI